MNFVKMSKYCDKEKLGVTEHSGGDMFVLGFYLTDDVYNFDGWKEWLLNDKYEDTCSNFSYVDKEKKGTILIGCLHSDDPDYDITIKKEQLLGLLDAWQECLAIKASEFIITKEGDNTSWKIVP